MANNNHEVAIRNLNLFVFDGNLGKIKDLTYMQNGNAVLNFSVCNNQDYTKEDGTVVKQPVWFNCAVYGTRAEGLDKILRRWKSVTVVAKVMGSRCYTTNNGDNASDVTIRVEEVYVKEWKDRTEQAGAEAIQESVVEEVQF